MDNIFIEATLNTPKISFNAGEGLLELEGKSIPEHANMFFRPLIDWIKKYAETKPEKLTMNVKLEYVNSSSQKFLVDIFENLEPIHISGTQVMVNWYYEEDDEEMKDTGEEFSESADVPFSYIGVEEF